MNAGSIRPLALGPIRTFEAVARHLSFSLAARELHLSQSAVSRQIRALEEEIGATLFVRGTRHVELSADGAHLLRTVAASLAQIDASVRQLRQARGRPVISVTTFASFSSMWLIPRLEAYQRVNPDIDIRVSASDPLVDLDDSDHDVALRYCQAARAGAAEPLFGESVTPVVSPLLARQAADGLAPALRTPADLAGHVLAEEDAPGASAALLSWRHWLTRQGLPTCSRGAGSTSTSPISRSRPRWPARRSHSRGWPWCRSRSRAASCSSHLVRPVASVFPPATGWRCRPARAHAPRCGSSPTGCAVRPAKRAWRSRAKATRTDRRSAQPSTPCSVTTSISGTSCGLGLELVGRHQTDRPADADRRRLRMRRQPTVEIAAAVAEPVTRHGVSDARHQHHVGLHRRTLAGWHAGFVEQRRWLPVPAPIVQRAVGCARHGAVPSRWQQLPGRVHRRRLR